MRRSLAATELLARAGYQQLAWINGGYETSKERELPVCMYVCMCWLDDAAASPSMLNAECGAPCIAEHILCCSGVQSQPVSHQALLRINDSHAS